MLVYAGQSRGGETLAELIRLGLGEMTQPRECPPRRYPWVLDNGAFLDWRSGLPFDAAAFYSACLWAAAQPVEAQPAFGVCPDRVATGLESLAFSLSWLDEHVSAFPALRWYLAVQDGMVESDVAPHLGRFAGVFVGGSMPWKLGTAERWARFASSAGVGCHVARISSFKRTRWAREIGATSIDSTQNNREPHKLARWAAIAAGERGAQATLIDDGQRIVAPSVGERRWPARRVPNDRQLKLPGSE